MDARGTAEDLLLAAESLILLSGTLNNAVAQSVTSALRAVVTGNAGDRRQFCSAFTSFAGQLLALGNCAWHDYLLDQVLPNQWLAMRAKPSDLSTKRMHSLLATCRHHCCSQYI